MMWTAIPLTGVVINLLFAYTPVYKGFRWVLNNGSE